MNEAETFVPSQSIVGNAYGREDSIRAGRCIDPPIGCGQVVSNLHEGEGFRNRQSRAEYLITARCQMCQDRFEAQEEREERETEKRTHTDVWQLRSHETGPLRDDRSITLPSENYPETY